MYNGQFPCRSVREMFFDSLFITECALCGNNIQNSGICENCLLSLEICEAEKTVFDVRIDDSSVQCAALYLYEYDAARKLVLYMKDNVTKSVTDFAALRLLSVLCRFGNIGTAIFTNVPRSISGIRRHGFDQAEILAKAVADMSENASYKRLLARKGRSKEQKKLSAEERLVNLSGKFRACHIFGIPEPKSIVIFDDVITTGSSVRECAAVLHEKYPDAKIYGVFLARA